MTVLDRKANGTPPAPSRPSATDAMLDALTRSDAAPTPESEAACDWEEMRREPAAHLTSPVIQALLAKTEASIATEQETLFTHLCLCEWCRNTLTQALNLRGAFPASRPLRELLGEALEWARLDAAAHDASTQAQQELLEQGIGYVYGKEGKVYRQMPDATDAPVDAATPKAGVARPEG